MSDGNALLRAVIAEPDEDLHRLVYADWLEELGDHVRARFIRVQCELARTEPTLTRSVYAPPLDNTNWSKDVEPNPRYVELKAEEAALFDALAGRELLTVSGSSYSIERPCDLTSQVWRRGFVEEICYPQSDIERLLPHLAWDRDPATVCPDTAMPLRVVRVVFEPGDWLVFVNVILQARYPHIDFRAVEPTRSLEADAPFYRYLSWPSGVR